MKRRLIPKSKIDQILIGLAVCTTLVAVVFFVFGDSSDRWLVGINVFFTVWCLTLAYVFQEEDESASSASDYTAVINRISGIVTELANLNAFLEKERSRISETESTIKRLTEQKSKLEPIVLTQRETVEAILSAHADRTGKNIWKERFLGFLLGAIASLVAAFAYDYIKR